MRRTVFSTAIFSTGLAVHAPQSPQEAPSLHVDPKSPSVSLPFNQPLNWHARANILF